MFEKRIIGIDIDGVITDETHPNKNIWHNALCNYLGYEVERVKDSYYFDEAYKLPSNTITSFLEDNIASIYKNARIAEGARETINYLYRNNFEIHLITAREPEFENITKSWLKEKKILYTSLTHEVNKAPLAVKKGIELFIEDNGYNTEELSKYNILVLLFNKYHNQYIVESKKTIRVYNWLEIKKQIDKYYSL